MTKPRITDIAPGPGADVVVVDTPVTDTVTAALGTAGYRLAALTARHAVYTQAGTGRGDHLDQRPAPDLSRPALDHPGGTDKAALSVAEAARTLGVSRSHAYELVKTGDLPHLRLGRRIVIPGHAIRQLLKT